MNKNKVSEIIAKLVTECTAMTEVLKKLIQLDRTKKSNEAAITELEQKSLILEFNLNSYLATTQKEIEELRKTAEFQSAETVANDMPLQTATSADIDAWHKKVIHLYEIVAEKYGNGLKKAA